MNILNFHAKIRKKQEKSVLFKSNLDKMLNFSKSFTMV